jgi:hypothetical protein
MRELLLLLALLELQACCLCETPAQSKQQHTARATLRNVMLARGVHTYYISALMLHRQSLQQLCGSSEDAAGRKA